MAWVHQHLFSQISWPSVPCLEAKDSVSVVSVGSIASPAGQHHPCCLGLWVGEERCLLRILIGFVIWSELFWIRFFFLYILHRNSRHLIFKWTVSKNLWISIFSYLTMTRHTVKQNLLIQDFCASFNIWQEFAYSCYVVQFDVLCMRNQGASLLLSPKSISVLNCSFWIPSWLYSFMSFILISSHYDRTDTDHD